MKRMLLLLGMLMLTLALVACGQNNDDDNANQDNGAVTNPEPDKDDNTTGQTDNENTNNGTTTDATAQDDMKQKMDDLEYTKFGIDVDYNNNKDYDAEIELDNNLIEAELEDDLNGVNIEGEEAFNKIYPNVKKLKIDQSTPKEDVIAEVMKAFDLPADYIKLEVEVKFKDGTKMEYEDRK